MTSTPPEAPPPPPPHGAAPGPDTGPRVSRDQMRDLGRLRRSITDRKVAGVAGGLGRHLDIDPLILRVAFVVLVFFGGAGLILYGACWLLVPEEGSERAPFNLDEKTRTVALIIVGAISALALIGDSWGAFWFPWPIAVVALIALWLLTRNNPPSPAGPMPYVAPEAPAGPAGPAEDAAYAAPAAGPTYPGPTYPVPPPAPPYGPSYGPPYAPGYGPTYPPPAPSRPWNPRKRGPILFWFTLALIVLAEGVLGLVDVAGGQVAVPAYPALAVAISGVMLVIGAFFGRAGGIILLGLLSTFGLAMATAADQWESDEVRVTPTSAAALEDRYWLDAGEQVVDLRDVIDAESLDGRRLEVEGGVGRIEIILPAEVGARVNANVDGPGHVDLFGEEHGGIDVAGGASVEGSEDIRMVIDARIGVGEIEVSHR